MSQAGSIGSGSSPSNPLSPASGGTGRSSLTAHGILIGEGTAPVNSLVLETGQIPVGVNGSDPVANGQILNISGTVGAPAYSFAADGTSGMYLDAGGFLGMVSLGTERAKFGNDGMEVNGSVIIDENLDLSTTSSATNFVDSGNITYIGITSTATAISVELNSVAVTGRIVIVKDESGAAGTNHITVSTSSGNIDGGSTYVISTNYGFGRFLFRNSQWWTI